MRSLVTQFSKFGVVGLVGLVIDLVVFNALIFTVLSSEVTHEGPIIAKVISTSLAIISNWLGNRYWTFGATKRHWLREGIEFAVVSIGGMLIAIGCLWVSHYALGFTSPLADNIATNVVGLALGTAFRFTLYRFWVFRGIGDDAAPLHHEPTHRADAAAHAPAVAHVAAPAAHVAAPVAHVAAPATPVAAPATPVPAERAELAPGKP